MNKYLIFSALFFWCTGCRIILFQETQNGVVSRITTSSHSFYGSFMAVESYSKKSSRDKFYFYLSHACWNGAVPSKSPQRWKTNLKGNRIPDMYAITDTLNHSYWFLDRILLAQREDINFIPITDDEKRLFEIATQKAVFDSCKAYPLSKIIGFINKIE